MHQLELDNEFRSLRPATKYTQQPVL